VAPLTLPRYRREPVRPLRELFPRRWGAVARTLTVRAAIVAVVGVRRAVADRGVAKVAVHGRMPQYQVPELQQERREVLRVGLPTVSACVGQHLLPTPSRANED
jgi:hypothetical protein